MGRLVFQTHLGVIDGGHATGNERAVPAQSTRLAHRHQVGGESGQFILSRGCFLVCTCGFAQVLEWHEGRADLDPIRLQSQGAFMALPVLGDYGIGQNR